MLASDTARFNPKLIQFADAVCRRRRTDAIDGSPGYPRSGFEKKLVQRMLQDRRASVFFCDHAALSGQVIETAQITSGNTHKGFFEEVDSSFKAIGGAHQKNHGTIAGKELNPP